MNLLKISKIWELAGMRHKYLSERKYNAPDIVLAMCDTLKKDIQQFKEGQMPATIKTILNKSELIARCDDISREKYPQMELGKIPRTESFELQLSELRIELLKYQALCLK